MKMWLTRDEDGTRFLWEKNPKFDKVCGEWIGNPTGVIIDQDLIIGFFSKKCFGVRKGGIAEVDVKLEITKL